MQHPTIGDILKKHRVYLEFRVGAYGLVRVVGERGLYHILSKADKSGARIVERHSCETEQALLTELDIILAEYR